jgi:hypothetical protein
VKAQVNSGRRREIYYFRDQQGLEVDFLVPSPGGGLRLIEAKASRTVTPAMAEPMRRLAEAWRRTSRRRGAVEMILVHEAPQAGTASRAVAPGVRALSWQQFVAAELGS